MTERTNERTERQPRREAPPKPQQEQVARDVGVDTGRRATSNPDQAPRH
jgi:hypothetical protein